MNKNFYLYAMFLVLFITAAYCIFSFSNVDLLGGFRSSDIDIGDGFSPIVEGNYEHKGTKSNPLSLYSLFKQSTAISTRSLDVNP